MRNFLINFQAFLASENFFIDISKIKQQQKKTKTKISYV